MKTHVYLKTIIGLLLVMVCSKAYSQQVIHPLQQFDNRINVKIITDKSLKGFKPQSQYIGIEITNKTQDKLQVVVSYYANLTCGSRVYGKNGATEEGDFLTPGKTSKADFWSNMNSFNVVDRLAPGCTDNEGLRIKVAENQFSWIQSVGYEIVSIENISEKERLKAKEEKERKDAETKKKQEETKKKQEEAARLKTETSAKATSANTSSSTNDDFWNDKPTAQNTSSGSSSQTTQKSKQQIDADKRLQESRDRYAEQENRFFNTMEKQKQEQDRRDAVMANSFYANEARSRAEQGISDNSSFNQRFDNVEDLQNAFYNQANAINQYAQDLSDARMQQNANAQEYLWGNSTGADQAVGELATSVANIIGSAKSEKERKEAQEKLRKERDAERTRIETERKQKIANLRNDIFKQYPEGGVPLSRHNISLDELYFFTYWYDGKTTAKVSNVFPYAKYKDGTWAFKDKVKAESEKATGSKVTLVGYFTTKALAEKERNVFVELLPQAEVQVTAYTVKGRKWDGAESGSTDFWGNETKEKQETKTTSKNTDDFWGDAPAKTDKKNETKKSESFWD